MARTIRTVDVVNAQSYKVVVHGMNVGTVLNVYYESQKVNSQVQPINKAINTPLVTDSNGKCEFIFYLSSPTGYLKNQSEANFIDLLAKDAGPKILTVVDQSSIDSDSLPDNFKNIARCYAELTVAKSFEVTFTQVKEWNGGKTTEALSGKITRAVESFSARL